MSNNEIITTPITTYKGFDRDMKCRGFQYEVGKTYTHEGEVKACGSGFHACEYPLDVFNYYPLTSEFAIVEQSGVISREGSDTKVASQHIHVKAKIDIPFMVKAAIEFTMSRAKPVDKSSPQCATGYQGASSASGTRGASSATGDQGASSATGDHGASSATGDQGASSATGDHGASSATGYQGASSATGTRGASSATGDHGASSATGYQGASSASGTRGASSATGDQGASSATGTRGASSATGYQGASSATGYQGASSATGYQGASSATGTHCVAGSYGFEAKAMATESNALVLVHRSEEGEIAHIRASKVGENGIKSGVWYSLDSKGEFYEVD